VNHGLKSRFSEWSRPPSPAAASGILVQSLYAATECEVDLARKRPGRAIGLRPWIAKQPLECCSCVAESHTLTRISPCEVHGVDAEGNVILRRQLKRRYVLVFFQKQPPCLLGIEACASSHHWSRALQALGHTVRLVPPAYVKPVLEP
jgi:hypothetical protein